MGFVGIFSMIKENFSRIAVGLPSLTFLLLKETYNLRKRQMIMATLLILIVANDMNVVVIIFTLNVLNPNRPIPEAMVDVEETLGGLMAMVEVIVTGEETVMVTVSISPVIAMMVTVNLCRLGNIIIMLMKIKSLRFLYNLKVLQKMFLLYHRRGCVL